MKYVAIIETHVGIKPHRKFAVPVPDGQSLDFDPGLGASRRWLRQYLGAEYHLVDFVEVWPSDTPN